MRIAVIGAGSAGLTSAWLLQAEHDVVVFEADGRAGGHVNTVVVEVDGRSVPVELGAEFFFQEGYGGLHALLGRFGIAPIRERLCVSLTTPERTSPAVVPPVHPRALATCLPPRTLRDLFWLWRFGVAGERVVAEVDWGVSVERLVERCGAPRDVADRLILPLVAASWGVTREQAAAFAAYSVVRVMGLRASQDPHSFRLPGGFATYIERLQQDSPRCERRFHTPVQGVDRTDAGLLVRAGGAAEAFDAVILACDWRNSAAMCAGSPHLDAWARAFRDFEDYDTTVAVHRDLAQMPASRHHWGASNFFLTREARPRTTVWSGRPSGAAVFRTWLRPDEPAPPSTTHVARYRHVACTTAHPARQAALARLQGTAGVWAAGMYTDGVDNHESALRSALRVAERIAPTSERVRWFAPRVSR